MANTYTTTYSFAKPDYGDIGWGPDVNNNFDVIDTVMGEKILSSGLLQNYSYHVEADFPNTTTLYGWHINGDSAGASELAWIGNANFSPASAVISASNNLEKTVYCGFNGSSLLTNYSPPAFGNGDLSVAFWAYLANWGGISTDIRLVSDIMSSGGWRVGFNSTGFYILTSPGTGDVNLRWSYGGEVAKLCSGWHHFVVSRVGNGNTNYYIDGVWSRSNISLPFIATDAELWVGSNLVGRLSELIIHKGTAWTEDQVKQIYIRGTKSIAAKDGTGVVSLLQKAIDYYLLRPLLTTGPSGWNPIYAYGRPYKDMLGNWYLEFWLRATFTSISSGTFTISGITAKNCGQDQACAAYSVGGSVVSYCEAGNNSGSFYFGFSGSSYSAIMVYGNIMLENAPSI